MTTNPSPPKDLMSVAHSEEREHFIVLAKRETNPAEAIEFWDYSAAADFFDRTQQQWSDVFLCRVLNGPGKPLRPSPPVRETLPKQPTQAQYDAALERAREIIGEGDFYAIVNLVLAALPPEQNHE